MSSKAGCAELDSVDAFEKYLQTVDANLLGEEIERLLAFQARLFANRQFAAANRLEPFYEMALRAFESRHGYEWVPF